MRSRASTQFVQMAVSSGLSLAMAQALAQTPAPAAGASPMLAPRTMAKPATVTCPNMFRAQWIDVEGWGLSVPQGWFLSARVVDPATGGAVIECSYSMNGATSYRPVIYTAGRTIGAGIKAAKCNVQGPTATCVQ